MKIITLNLARDTTQNELSQLFKAFGEVESCDLVLDKAKGTSKGFGFVEMPNELEAKAAIKALHGKKVGANKIRVKESEPK